MRYFVRFSYFGKAYHGWQRQPNALTVQELMENAFTTLFRKPVNLVGAGRTDTGVHAREMWAHADLNEIKDFKELLYRLNAMLPEDIAIQEIRAVKPDSHARFHAIERTYDYQVITRKDPFRMDFAHYLHQLPDIDAMNGAASLITEYNDFQCFSKSNTDVKTYVCDIREAVWTPEEDGLRFRISADRFLRNMVRAIVGTLLEVGQGKMVLEDVKGIIKSGDRSRAGASVPAKGLYLTRVCYPDSLFL